MITLPLKAYKSVYMFPKKQETTSMTPIKIMAIALLLTAISSQNIFADTRIDPNTDLKWTITKLLKRSPFHAKLDEHVRISFFVTADERVVVLKTDSRTKELDKFIKNQLNYKKINVKNLEVNRIFHIKVHFDLDK